MKRNFITLVLLLSICGICAADISYVETNALADADGTSCVGSTAHGSAVGSTQSSGIVTIEKSATIGIANTIGCSIGGRARGGSSVSAWGQTSNTEATTNVNTNVDVRGTNADGRADGNADFDVGVTIVKPQIVR